MFEFHWPWAALLLPLPLLLHRFWPRRAESPAAPDAGRRETLFHPRPDLLAAAYTVRRPGPDLGGWVHRVLLGLLWVALVAALMRPQWLTAYPQVSTPGYDLMLAVDASHSMDALDFSAEGRQVTRMQVVKGVMGRFLAGREGDRVGLILFGSQAFVLAPLTTDRHAVAEVLDGVVTGLAGQGTALGDAIALGVKKLRERPPQSRVMILIADGDNTQGSFAPAEAARLARFSGVRIYVIGVGSTAARIPILEDGVVKVREDLVMNEEVLREIAAITGGAWFRATDTGALESIAGRIGQLEKTEAVVRTAYISAPLFRWPLGAALAAALALGLFPEGRRRFVTAPGAGSRG